jgi:hypothetical protein
MGGRGLGQGKGKGGRNGGGGANLRLARALLADGAHRPALALVVADQQARVARDAAPIAVGPPRAVVGADEGQHEPTEVRAVGPAAPCAEPRLHRDAVAHGRALRDDDRQQTDTHTHTPYTPRAGRQAHSAGTGSPAHGASSMTSRPTPGLCMCGPAPSRVHGAGRGRGRRGNGGKGWGESDVSP